MTKEDPGTTSGRTGETNQAEEKEDGQMNTRIITMIEQKMRKAGDITKCNKETEKETIMAITNITKAMTIITTETITKIWKATTIITDMTKQVVPENFMKKNMCLRKNLQ